MSRDPLSICVFILQSTKAAPCKVTYLLLFAIFIMEHLAEYFWHIKNNNRTDTNFNDSYKLQNVRYSQCYILQVQLNVILKTIFISIRCLRCGSVSKSKLMNGMCLGSWLARAFAHSLYF